MTSRASLEITIQDLKLGLCQKMDAYFIELLKRKFEIPAPTHTHESAKIKLSLEGHRKKEEYTRIHVRVRALTASCPPPLHSHSVCHMKLVG